MECNACRAAGVWALAASPSCPSWAASRSPDWCDAPRAPPPTGSNRTPWTSSRSTSNTRTDALRCYGRYCYDCTTLLYTWGCGRFLALRTTRRHELTCNLQRTAHHITEHIRSTWTVQYSTSTEHVV